MKKFFYSAVLCSVLLYGCGREKAVKIEKHNGEDLYVCDYFKVSDSTTVLKMSDLVESLELIKLDNDTSATVDNGSVYLSENHMLIRAGYNAPIKLFDRSGKYLCNVGTVGRGPGEYMSVYDMQLDEKNKHIFLMPWQARRIQKYDFEGKFIEDIPLLGGFPKGMFNMQEDRITVIALPFKGLKWFAYQQTLDGKLLDSVSIKPFEINEPNPYNNELLCDRSISSVYIFRPKGRQDTLYHYVPGKSGLIPRFTVNYSNVEEIPIHDYHEVGDYFWFTTSRMEPTGENSFTYKSEKNVLVNKKTLEASRFNFVNDLMGGYDASLWGFINGYYIENVDPVRLKDKLEKALEKGEMNDVVKKRVTDLLGSINENDNNYIFIGKLK